MMKKILNSIIIVTKSNFKPMKILEKIFYSKLKMETHFKLMDS